MGAVKMRRKLSLLIVTWRGNFERQPSWEIELGV